MESMTAPPPDASTVGAGAPNAAKVSTAAIVATMLKVSHQISDLIFSPGREPQVEISGQLRELNIAGVGKLSPALTKRIATDLIGSNTLVAEKLEREGSTDLSYGLPRNRQISRKYASGNAGPSAIVMRVIPHGPSLTSRRSACLLSWARQRTCRRRHRPGNGSHRFRKIVDAGSDP